MAVILTLSVLLDDLLRFDCVFPTRTARFGVALVTHGSVRLKSKEHSTELGPVDPECRCSTCRNYSRAVLHVMFKEGNALAAQLLTKHNVSYMMRLMRTMRKVQRLFFCSVCSLQLTHLPF